MCGGGGGGGDSTNVTTVRFAQYIEDKHQHFLLVSSINADVAYLLNPYDDDYDGRDDPTITVYDFSDVLYGVGNTISDLTSMQEMFGTYMEDLDLDVLWTASFDSVQNNTVVANMVSAEGDLLDDDIEESTLPRFTAGMRDINSIVSSSFATGKAIIESARTKQLAKFDAELRYKLIPIAADQWKTKIAFNQSIVSTYVNMITLMINTDMITTDANYGYTERAVLWNFKVLDLHRANIAALQGAITSKGVSEGPEGVSQVQKAVGGLMGGVSAGATASGGHPVGAIAGGILGLAASFF